MQAVESHHAGVLRHYAAGLFFLGPLLGIATAMAFGNAVASEFALVALVQWAMLYGLLNIDWADRIAGAQVPRWTPVVALALWAICLTWVARDHSAAKIFYSMLTLGCLVGMSGWAVRRFSGTGRWRDLAVEAVALLALAGWLLYGESDWYYVPVTPMGTPQTQPYLVDLPLWWWGACMAIPAVALTWLSASRRLTPEEMSQRLRPFFDPGMQRALFSAGLLIIFLMALLQTLDFILPRLGRQIYEGDEFGYVIATYHLLQQGEFNPSHMPMISLYIALIMAIAGDSTTAMMLGNGIVLMLTIALLLWALWLIAPDKRFVLLGGLMLVSLRSCYLFVWTPLSETLNNALWAAAIVGLFAAARRAKFQPHFWLGLVIALLLLTRSQNLGGILGLGIAYVALAFMMRPNPTAMPMRSIAVVMLLLAATAGPLFAWGKYREATIGRFQVMDGRGAEVFLGMNMPGARPITVQWEENVTPWKAQHPNASSLDMVLAGVRYRLERPAESAWFYWTRTVELFNANLSIPADAPFWHKIRPNQQLIVAISACLLLLLSPARWLGAIIWVIFLPFVGIFIAIYVEPRYRIPMDPLLSIGAAALLAQALFKVRFPACREEPSAPEFPGLARVPVFAMVVAVNLVLIGCLRAIEVMPLYGRPSSFAAADLQPIGARLTDQPPVDWDKYKQLPTWEEIIKTDDPASLQGKLFRGRFGLIGNTFRLGNIPAYVNMELPQDEEFQRADSTRVAPGNFLHVERISLAFNNAVIEKGIKQRGVIDFVGRVRPLPHYYAKNFKFTQFVFIDVLFADCSYEAIRQPCAHRQIRIDP
jgi:hypothetical protein